MSRLSTALIVLVLLAGAGFGWAHWHAEISVVARQLEALANEINAGTTDGAGLAARSAQLSLFFTDDVQINLGPGSSVVRGRATVLDMMSRLQPRTSAFQLHLTDTTVTLGSDPRLADVVLTAEFIRKGDGEDSIDARELAIQLTKADGTWRIHQLTIVEAFR
ncbi:MAG: nuclear transport factor 2 family protein [Vicinamibacterales bacterium]